MFKFLLPLIAALRVPLHPASGGWGVGQDVAQAYLGCKKELIRYAEKSAVQKVRSPAAAETKPTHEQG